MGLRAVRGARLRQPGNHPYEGVRHVRALWPAGTGIETGRTPREVVWEKGKTRLYRYDTDVEKRFAVPVLLVYALILRPYILDLVPNRIAHLQNVLNLCTSRLDWYRRQNRTTGANDRGIDLLWALEVNATFPHRKAIEEVGVGLYYTLSQHV